jgi:hypothetical protein
MSWESWDERLEWNMVQIRKLAIINDQRAEARRKKKVDEIRKAREAGLDIPEPKPILPSSIPQSTARKMERHELDLGDICRVTAGKFAEKKVLVIKAGIQTKFGLKTITVEYFSANKTGEKVWVSPDQLEFQGEADLETANAIKEADFQEWKARKAAGVPPASQFKNQNAKGSGKGWWKEKESDKSDGDFL